MEIINYIFIVAFGVMLGMLGAAFVIRAYVAKNASGTNVGRLASWLNII